MLDKMYESFGISKTTVELAKEIENRASALFKSYDDIVQFNQLKVLKAMQDNRVDTSCFNVATGYGYNDYGRDTLEKIYAQIFNTEDALVRAQIVSGTHALYLTLSALTDVNDEILSPVGAPYDTLQSVIGIKKTANSLIEKGIKYAQVDLIGNDFDYDNIKKAINKNTRLVTIQRSKGYTLRESFSVKKIGQLISFIKNIDENIIIMVDNCYGEFVDYIEPTDVGADLAVGSLIKNPGGGLAASGGYIVGKKKYIEKIADRLTAPGLGKEVGASLGQNAMLYQGLFQAPFVAVSALKGAVFTAGIFETAGYKCYPKFDYENRSDIIQAVTLGDEKRLYAFCEGVQAAAPVDSYVKPVGDDMPGYEKKVIMAAGTFIQGSSIELSADAPVKEPYNVYFQGGLSYYHAKLGAMKAFEMVKSVK